MKVMQLIEDNHNFLNNEPQSSSPKPKRGNRSRIPPDRRVARRQWVEFWKRLRKVFEARCSRKGTCDKSIKSAWVKAWYATWLSNWETSWKSAWDIVYEEAWNATLSSKKQLTLSGVYPDSLPENLPANFDWKSTWEIAWKTVHRCIWQTVWESANNNEGVPQSKRSRLLDWDLNLEPTRPSTSGDRPWSTRTLPARLRHRQENWRDIQPGRPITCPTRRFCWREVRRKMRIPTLIVRKRSEECCLLQEGSSTDGMLCTSAKKKIASKPNSELTKTKVKKSLRKQSSESDLPLFSLETPSRQFTDIPLNC